MKLSKNKWETKKLTEVCADIFAGGDVPKNNFSKTKTDELSIPIFSNGEKNKGLYGYTNIGKVTIPSLTISARGTIGYSEIREEKFYPAVRLIVVTPNSNLLDLYFLKFVIGNTYFASSGTAIPQLTVPMVKQYEIPLPSLPEQYQIAELFQSIETAIEQAEQQENKLKTLRNSLINFLTKQKPQFGNLIDSKKCKQVSVADVAEEISARVDNPSKSEYVKFVGLEDFETGELRINKYSSTEGLVSAMKLFKIGDVLFARRNVYLKRVSQAVFDGVCSGDAIVMRANEKIIFPELLTLILNTNEFWDYALSNAAGAFSKRIKWRELAVYSFELPDLKTQEKIVEVFQQIEKTLDELKTQKQTLKNLKQKLLNEILG